MTVALLLSGLRSTATKLHHWSASRLKCDLPDHNMRHCDGTGVKGCPTSTLQVCSMLCGLTGMSSSGDAPWTLTFHDASYGCRTSCHTMACMHQAMSLSQQHQTLTLVCTHFSTRQLS